MAKNNAKLVDPSALIAAGIDAKTGLPAKLGSLDCTLQQDITKTLRIVDEQDAVNRYTWYNLPSGLTSQMIERMLYYKGQLMFFYMETDNNFYMLPYALDGGIDVYGRFKAVTPLPFNGTAETKKDAWITGLIRKPQYEVVLPDDLEINTLADSCVLLYDYTNQLSQTLIPRQILNDPIVKAEAEAYPLARTAMISHSGVKGVRVGSEDEATQVQLASKAITSAALSGNPWVPMIGNQEFQDLTEGSSTLKSEEFLMYMQSMDNFRLSLYGLDSGGIFEKQRKLQAEQAMNCGNNSIILQDGLSIRQRFCDIVNSIWGIGIWCDISESAAQVDKNLDGIMYEEQDQSGMMEGEQPEMGGE